MFLVPITSKTMHVIKVILEKGPSPHYKDCLQFSLSAKNYGILKIVKKWDPNED